MATPESRPESRPESGQQSQSGSARGGRRPTAPGSAPMGRFLGVPIYVSPSWLLFLIFITVQFGPLVKREVPDIGGAAYAVSFAFGVFLGLSVLAHELGHCVAARSFGVPVQRISLTFLAGNTTFEREPDTPWQSFVVAGVGPATNAVIALGSWLGARSLPADSVGGVLTAGLAWTNALVAAYNLLPGLPLDGGQLLRAVIWGVRRDQRVGTIGAAWAGRLLGALTAAVGMYLFVQRSAQARFDGVWALLVAGMVFASSSAILRQQSLRDRLPAISARALTRRALPVSADLPLAEAVRRAQVSQARGLVIVDGSGRPTAVVNEAAVNATPVERRPWVTAGSVSRGVASSDLVSVALNGEELLRRLQATPASEYVVVDPTGDLYGVLAAADVAQALRA